ncbi:MAG TPA: hypothetical protein VMH39_07985, partial [Gemmatimonadaceae bacterium]|nr:hypothetical protein [Gemmatimonadaceae bacterium]
LQPLANVATSVTPKQPWTNQRVVMVRSITSPKTSQGKHRVHRIRVATGVTNGERTGATERNSWERESS